MNLNKDPESWARVKPEIVLAGSDGQGINVMKMALEDIQRLARENDRLHRQMQESRYSRSNEHSKTIRQIIDGLPPGEFGVRELVMLCQNHDQEIAPKEVYNVLGALDRDGYVSRGPYGKFQIHS